MYSTSTRRIVSVKLLRECTSWDLFPSLLHFVRFLGIIIAPSRDLLAMRTFSLISPLIAIAGHVCSRARADDELKTVRAASFVTNRSLKSCSCLHA